MLVAGLDVGTTGLKGLLVDEMGAVVAETTVPYRSSSPRPGWSEQDAEDWWRAAQAACARLAPHGAPVAIGLSGQMHGAVFLDAGDRLLAPAILWNDQRTAAECAAIETLTAGRIREWTLNPPRTAFTATKLLWCRTHAPEVWAATRTVLLPKDLVRLRLTGERASEVTDASGTLLLDVRGRRWSQPTLDALELSAELLPRLVESPEPTGAVHVAASAACGLPAGVTVVGGGGDQAAAAIGNGVAAPGVLSITIGTSGVVYAQLGEVAVDPTGAFHTFCHAIPGTWQMMAGVLSAGGSLDWFRDALAADAGGLPDFERLAAGAEEVPPGSAGLVFLPYLTGERSPHNDPDARGAWLGLTRRHDRRHLARAVIEGVCFALRDLVDIVAGLGVPVREIRIAGGGARGRLWLTTLATVLQRPVLPAATADASAFGAAMLAMSAASGRSLPELAAAWVRTLPPVAPDPAAGEVLARTYEVYRSLYPATAPAMHRLSAIERGDLMPGAAA